MKEYAETFNEKRQCCNVDCQKCKWEMDWDHYDKCQKKKEELHKNQPWRHTGNLADIFNIPSMDEEESRLHDNRYIKHKFYRCSGCMVAVYCSRLCQKRHGNYGGHKAQCEAIYECSDLLL